MFSVSQAVQAPGLGRLALGPDLGRGFLAARQYPLAMRIGDKAPEQDALAPLGFHLLDGPLLLQAGPYQGRVVDRQQGREIASGSIVQPLAQCRVEVQRLRLGVQQQAGLRVVAEPGRVRQLAFTLQAQPVTQVGRVGHGRSVSRPEG